MSETSTFLEFSNSIGSNQKLKKKIFPNESNRRITVVEMRQDIISRAHETIIAITNQYKKRAFKSPMAKSIRNGLQVKIGYGKRNQKIVFGDDLSIELKPRNFTHQEKHLAVYYIQEAINAVQNGEFDDALQKMNEKFEHRFLPAAEKEKRKAEKLELERLIEQAKSNSSKKSNNSQNQPATK